MSIAVEVPGHVAAAEGDRARRSRTAYHGRPARSCPRIKRRRRFALERISVPEVRTIGPQRSSAPLTPLKLRRPLQSGRRAALGLVRSAPVPPLAAPAVLVRHVRRPMQAADTTATQAVRLTHRGQVVVLLASALLALAVAAGSWASQRADTPKTPVSTPAHVAVVSGDTLWAIARRVAPTRDPRAEVDDLLKLNSLGGAPLVPGQLLRVR